MLSRFAVHFFVFDTWIFAAVLFRKNDFRWMKLSTRQCRSHMKACIKMYNNCLPLNFRQVINLPIDV